VIDKVKLDATLAVRAGDWLIRRAIFDSGRVLGAAASTFAALGAAPSEDEAEQKAKQEKAAATPFASRLTTLETAEEGRRALAAGSEVAALQAAGASLRDELAAASSRAEAAEAEVAAAEAARRAEAEEKAATVSAALVNSSAAALQGVAQALELDVDDKVAGNLGKLGEALPNAVAAAAGEVGVLLQRSQRDFESFNALSQRGQLPTLAEEVQDQLQARSAAISARGRPRALALPWRPL
jgi:hypothetical protein